MFNSLGYDGAAASAVEWLQNLSPIVIFIGGVALALTLAGLALALVASSRSSAGAAPSGLDKDVR